MSEPKIVFGDDPTGALNTKTAKEYVKLRTECKISAFSFQAAES